MSNWISFIVLGVLLGIISMDLSFDHYSIIDESASEQSIKAAISYYNTIENQAFPYNAIIPALIAVFAIDFVIRLVRYMRLPDLITLFLLIAAVGSFVITLTKRAELVQTSDYVKQKELVKAIAYSHTPQFVLIPIGILLQLWSQNAGRSGAASSQANKKKRA